jgi:hypothetical protein
LDRGAPVLEIVLNLTVVVPAGFIALAVVFIGRRKPPNQREIDISLRFSREVAPPPAARGGAGPIFSFCAGRGRAETPISGHLLHRGQKLVDQAEPTSSLRTYREHESLGMLPLYATRIEDLGLGDFVKVDCAACHRVALLRPEALLRQGLSPAAKVVDLKGRLRCRGCGRKGRAVVSIKWRAQGA